MSIDHSEGWEDVAQAFMAARSGIGAALVLNWARDNLAPSSSIVDAGCGSGVPIAQGLICAGFAVSGIDASPTLLAAFQNHFPDAPAACEAAQDSAFFDRTFDAAIAIGLIFLLGEDDQRKIIRRIANALRPQGRFLFSAPFEVCEWPDLLTGRVSRSLGADAYERLLQASGLRLVACLSDEGRNNYYHAVRV